MFSEACVSVILFIGGVAVGRGSLSRGLLCSESLCLGDLCPGVFVSGGSLYRGLCPGGAWIESPPPVATAMVKVQTYFGSQYFVIDHHCKNRSESLDIVTFVGIG